MDVAVVEAEDPVEVLTALAPLAVAMMTPAARPPPSRASPVMNRV
jgi:hypothetical protein